MGIVTVDDGMDVLEEEATEDFEKMAAMAPSERPYLKAGVFTLARHRIVWLLVLMISGMITGGILGRYEAAFSAMPLLVTFIPMLTDTGGNAGSQASVTVIRGMALDEIRPRDIVQVIWKELRVSVLIAATVGVACFAKLQLIDRLIFGFDYTLYYSAAVSVAIALAVIVAKIVGCCVPIFAKTIHIAPAVFANPFITTITDVLSLLLFCAVSLGLFHIMA